MADLQIAEGSKYEALSGVQKEIKELKEVHANTTSLYQSQIEMLKDKIQPSNKKEEILHFAYNPYFNPTLVCF
jgi:hypothetical protein